MHRIVEVGAVAGVLLAPPQLDSDQHGGRRGGGRRGGDRWGARLRYPTLPNRPNTGPGPSSSHLTGWRSPWSRTRGTQHRVCHAQRNTLAALQPPATRLLTMRAPAPAPPGWALAGWAGAPVTVPTPQGPTGVPRHAGATSHARSPPPGGTHVESVLAWCKRRRVARCFHLTTTTVHTTGTPAARGLRRPQRGARVVCVCGGGGGGGGVVRGGAALGVGHRRALPPNRRPRQRNSVVGGACAVGCGVK